MFHSTLLGVPETFSSLFLTVTDYTHYTTADSNQEYFVCYFAATKDSLATSLEDNSGAYTVFTEQGSSASQMTTAKIIDVIARLPGCDGQEADAVSANSQVKLEDAPRLLKIPNSECPDIWICLPRHKCPKS